MPINDGQYHQTIAALWISYLDDILPQSPVMVAHIASDQLTNPRKITTDQGIISFSFPTQVRLNHIWWSILTT